MDAKKVIAPLQYWLLTKRRCVGCGQPLDQKTRKRKNGVFVAICTCKRAFIYDPKIGSYRRALFEEP